MVNWVDGYFQNSGWLKIPKVTTDGSGVPTGEITYLGQVVPVSGIALTDVWAAGGVRFDGVNFIDENGTALAGTPAVADQTALLALNAATYEDYSFTVSSGLNRSVWTSNGTVFGPLNGQYIQEKSNTSVRNYIAPESGLTWSAADNGSGKVRLTCSGGGGVHGLTTSPAVGASLCVKTTQNGWTSGDFHEIATIVSTTQIDLTTSIGSLGVPVFYVKNEEVTAKTITLPFLRNNTVAILEFNMGFSISAAANSRRTKMYLGATLLNNNNFASTSNAYTPFRWGFKNLGATNSQRGLAAENSTGYGAATGVPDTAAIDTSTAQTLSITFLPDIANITMEMMDYTLIIRS